MSASVNIAGAVELLRQGQLVAFPTETVYGLGADATDDMAVARVYAAKGRPVFNPLISHVVSHAQAEELGEFSRQARRLAEAFWPGPLTIVVPRTPGCPVSMLASAGLPSLALRVPLHPMARELLERFGRPVVAPSANISGRTSPTSADHVRRGLGDRVALVLDGGSCAVGIESTVVSFMKPEPELLRPGGIPREAIESAMGLQFATPQKNSVLHSPGQLESHYAPAASLRMNATSCGENEVYLGFGTRNGHENLSPDGDLVEAAANLFRMLHELDARGAATIAVAPIPAAGLGDAINDRLSRAAAPRS